MTRLRVASYNTRDFLDDRVAAAAVVRAIAPDVLCLQEVPRRLGATRRVAAFAQACGMRWVGRHRGSGGTTIFVSEAVEVDLAGHHRLAVALFDRTRGYAVARLRVPGWPALTVASVHLGLREQERERHTQTILAGLGPRAGEAVIVGGDLNEGSDGAAFRCLLGALRVVSSDQPTYPSWRPHAVLDVIFASKAVQVVEGPAVRLSHELLVAASDHRPIWVDLVPSLSV